MDLIPQSACFYTLMHLNVTHIHFLYNQPGPTSEETLS